MHHKSPASQVVYTEPPAAAIAAALATAHSRLHGIEADPMARRSVCVALPERPHHDILPILPVRQLSGSGVSDHWSPSSREILSYDKVFVPCDADINLARKLGAELPVYWEQQVAAHGEKWRRAREMRDAYYIFAQARTLGDLMSATDQMLGLVACAKAPRADVRRALTWLTRLWVYGLIAIPPKWTAEFRINCPISNFTVGDHVAWLEEIAAVTSVKSDRESRRAKGLALRIATTTVGVKELGDLTPTTTAEAVRESMGTRAFGIVKAILNAQHVRYGAAASSTLADWGLKPYRVRKKSDVGFLWATAVDPALEHWRRYLAQWLSERPVKSQALIFGEFFLNYLLANPTVTRNPEEFCRRTYMPTVLYRDWLELRHRNQRALFDSNNRGAEFIEWLLDTHLSTPDDLGRPVRSPNHWNPITRLQRKAQAIQTHREAIPTRYINELIRILTERDAAWPKSLPSEWFSWFDHDAGRWERIWNPVRASALLLKLYLPLRTFQIRMLDSGEADSERYVGGQWVANAGPLAPRQRTVVRRGFLRKFTDRLSGQVYTGFFVNTNKTQDWGRDEEDKGYEIPWQHGDAITVATDLLGWQERYNPIITPQRWADLHDSAIVRTGRSGKFARRGEVCFLFRDPCGTYRNEPLTDSRLRPFWFALLNELEQRVAARGETLTDGSPILFIDKRNPKSGEPRHGVYDLHTIRVSLITALATEGGVPIPILSKCVAGHASILMTLYYIKLGVPQISETLAEAQKKIGLEEQRNFVCFLQSAEHKALASLVASNDASGVIALHDNTPGSWIIGDKGICPVGGAMCSKGGPKLTSNIQLSDYAPTPGGPRNCVRCRFFVTGPAFLGGLVAHFNAVGVQLLAAAERFRAGEATIRRLEDEITATDKQTRRSSLMADLHTAQDRHQRGILEVDDLAHNLHAIYRLTERCRAAARTLARADPSQSSRAIHSARTTTCLTSPPRRSSPASPASRWNRQPKTQICASIPNSKIPGRPYSITIGGSASSRRSRASLRTRRNSMKSPTSVRARKIRRQTKTSATRTTARAKSLRTPSPPTTTTFSRLTEATWEDHNRGPPASAAMSGDQILLDRRPVTNRPERRGRADVEGNRRLTAG